jgi:hypothetical protein
MLTIRHARRAQRMLLLLGLLLALYYFAGHRPLSRRAERLQVPRAEMGKNLAAVGVERADAVTLAKVEGQLARLKSSLVVLKSGREALESSVAFPADVQAKIREPFQLVDYQIEKQFLVEELSFAAQQHQVSVSPAVLAAFPDYSAEQTQPNLLWAQLAIVNQLLSSVVECKVASIEMLEVPAPVNHRFDGTNSVLDEIAVRIEMRGSMAALGQWLATLPQRTDAGTNLVAVKPAVFIDRFLLRKSSRENSDEARLEVKVCAFSFHDPVPLVQPAIP